MEKPVLPVLSLASGLLSLTFALPAFGQTATAPYQLTVFAKAPTGLSAPDSVAVLRDHVSSDTVMATCRMARTD
jgi:hypothetical protein